MARDQAWLELLQAMSKKSRKFSRVLGGPGELAGSGFGSHSSKGAHKLTQSPN